MIKKYSGSIVLAILWLISIHSIIKIFTNNYIVGIPNYVGYSLLLLTTIAFLTRLPIVKLILAVLLFLATIQLIQFTYYTLGVRFIILPQLGNHLILGVQPVNLILLLFLVYHNQTETVGYIFNSKNSEKSELIKRHYYELMDNADHELDEIIKNSSKENEEKRIAAQIVIRERKTKA